MTDEYPKLRVLDAFPHQTREGLAVVLRDPLQISQEVLLVPPQLLAILSLMDGCHSLSDLRQETALRTGQLVSLEELAQIVTRLDQARFLESTGFQRQQEELIGHFLQQTIREPFHAGLGYPAEPNALTDLLDSYYRHPDGAGLPTAINKPTPRGVVAPHIDLRLGGPLYTHSYRTIAEAQPPDVFIILGIGHMGLPGFYSVAMKDFRTPLGTVPCDRELASLIIEAGRGDFDEDFSHRSEHSIEFQTLFLHHLFAADTPAIVPVLTSFSYFQLDRSGWRTVDRFCRAVQDALAATGKRACFIAGVDLAHIGPRYGDSSSPGPDAITSTLTRDRALLELVASGDPAGLVECIRAEKDARRICGFSALVTLLHLLEGASGRCLAQGHCLIDESGSFVTFGGVVFDEPPKGTASPDSARSREVSRRGPPERDGGLSQ